MDWTTVSSVFQGSIQVVATLIATGTVVWGINTWRREHIGRKKIDLAEEILALAYEARDAFERIRYPLELAGEGGSRTSGREETPDEKAALNYAYIPVERWNERADLFAKLRSLRYRFMALNGKEYDKPFDELVKIRCDLARPYRALKLKIDDLHKRRPGENDSPKYKEELNESWEKWQQDRDAQFGDDGDDLLIGRFDKMVHSLENLCRTVIASQA